MNEKIIFKNFNVSYGETVVFKNFNCEFNAGEITAILGPSGSGKTTLLNVVAGLVPYTGEMSPVYKNVSYVFQESRLIPEKTVFKNLDLILKDVCPNKKLRAEKIFSMLKSVGLENDAKKYPKQLSGGMAGRVSLARAFLYTSEILLMDEPFRGLDAKTKGQVIDIFKSLWAKDKRTALLVTHDMEEAKSLASKIYVLPDKPISNCLVIA